MGANAQTSVPAFTAGQVLTAAQVTQINTGIPVFASSTERDAAFGGSGEKTLAEGQMAYLEDTNATQYYDGSSWVAVGGGGIELITTQAFSGVASVSIDNCFTSTYDNYKITIQNVIPAVAGNAILRLRASSTDTTTGYNQARLEVTGTSVGGIANPSTTYWSPSYLTTDGTDFVIHMFEPQNVRATKYIWNAARGTTYLVSGAGGQSATTQFDGFTLAPASSTFSGTIRVYGLKD